MEALDGILSQAAKAAAYYIALIVLVRIAGKRLAGQTTTFDLLVLITLGVVLQSAALCSTTPSVIRTSRSKVVVCPARRLPAMRTSTISAT